MPKKTFEIAEETKTIFITQVKDNQKSLLQQIQHGTQISKLKGSYTEEYEKGHGRLEKRTYEVFDSQPMLKKWPEWHLVRRIVRVTRERNVYDRKAGRYRESREVSYYICNRKLSASRLGKYIRQHWHIENKLHHVKDATFREDYNRKEVRPENFSLCIDLALNILRYNKYDNIKGATYEISIFADKYIPTLSGLVC